jgi:hypothetical protein
MDSIVAEAQISGVDSSGVAGTVYTVELSGATYTWNFDPLANLPTEAGAIVKSLW